MLTFRERQRWGVLFSISLLLCLPTNYRFTETVGFGELGLALCMLIFFTHALAGYKKSQGLNASVSMPLSLLIYLVFILLPVTLLNSLYDNGALLRDYLAFLFCGLLILSCALYSLDMRRSMRIFCVFLISYLVVTYLLGGEGFWYSIRFTGGAKNPNQLALYIVCAIYAASLSFEDDKTKYFVMACLATIGLATFSDAYYLFLGVVLACYVAVAVFPHKFFLITFPVMLLVMLCMTSLLVSDLSDYIADAWDNADQGGSRTSLYLHGLMAWSDNFYTLVFGNGAGAFSGQYMPFEGAEAHNTPIDMLSIGGLVAFLLFYSYLFYVIWAHYRLGRKIEVSILLGIFVFSLFHFVLRHPVFWIAIYMAGMSLKFYTKESS